MAKCGSCKADGQTVAHIRECYATTYLAPNAQEQVMEAVKAEQAVPVEAYKPMALTTKPVPASKYAVEDADGEVTFYEVKRPTKGNWKGFVFVDRLVGHPGDWQRYPVKGAAKAKILAGLAEDPKAAALLFCDRFRVCSCCGSPLSATKSLEDGIGPICIKRFAA